jgi:hypothetical protein
VVGELVAGAVRVGHGDPQVGAVVRLAGAPKEGRVVVAAVPDDDMRVLLLRRPQDGLVVNARKHHGAGLQVLLVLLALLNRHLQHRAALE